MKRQPNNLKELPNIQGRVVGPASPSTMINTPQAKQKPVIFNNKGHNLRNQLKGNPPVANCPEIYLSNIGSAGTPHTGQASTPLQAEQRKPSGTRDTLKSIRPNELNLDSLAPSSIKNATVHRQPGVFSAGQGLQNLISNVRTPTSHNNVLQPLPESSVKKREGL